MSFSRRAVPCRPAPPWAADSGEVHAGTRTSPLSPVEKCAPLSFPFFQLALVLVATSLYGLHYYWCPLDLMVTKKGLFFFFLREQKRVVCLQGNCILQNKQQHNVCPGLSSTSTHKSNMLVGKITQLNGPCRHAIVFNQFCRALIRSLFMKRWCTYCFFANCVCTIMVTAKS